MHSEAVPRVITIGETMVLVAPASAEPLAAATDFRLDVGGAESNVASHLAHLGVPAAWVSAVGADALGERLSATLVERGVDTRWVRTADDAHTGVYFKDPARGVLYYRAGSAASRMGPSSISEVPLEDAMVVHISGITPALSPTCADLIDSVCDRVAASDAVLSFDVNHRPTIWPAETAGPVLRTLAGLADLVFVGLDEAERLWGCVTADDVRALLPEPDRLVVKDGGVGATEFHGDERVFVAAIPTEIAEAVGAGDAFAAGYLAASLSGAPAPERLLAGHRQARLVLQSTSDFLSEPSSRKADDGRQRTLRRPLRRGPPDGHPAGHGRGPQPRGGHGGVGSGHRRGRAADPDP